MDRVVCAWSRFLELCRLRALPMTVVAFMLPVLAVNTHAESFYTWTDERGVTHVSDQPPDEEKMQRHGGRAIHLDPVVPGSAPAAPVPSVTAPSSRPVSRSAQTRDGADMAGVEWRETPGVYAGKEPEETTQKFGYRAGQYRLQYQYKGGRHFSITVHTRRGRKEVLVDIVRTGRSSVIYTLPEDDEVWFEVLSSFGTWAFTFERMP